MVHAALEDEALELCGACDRHDPAAASLIAWTLVDGMSTDPAALEEGGRLMVEWSKSEMAKRGWQWVGLDGDPDVDP